eukprot:COSAG01_NODE_17700_length_1130_cov_4.734239_1_plen_196_part_10
MRLLQFQQVVVLQKEHPEKWDPSDTDVWNPQTHGAAVKLLKDVLCTYPVLRLPDTTKQFFVLSGSSTRAGGVCLGQRDDETGKLYAVGYASKVWSDTQAKYTCTELELLSILLALKKWRPLLLGTTVVVRIYTDHSANASLEPRTIYAMDFITDLRDCGPSCTPYNMVLVLVDSFSDRVFAWPARKTDTSLDISNL